jgi:hypothetical protein
MCLLVETKELRHYFSHQEIISHNVTSYSSVTIKNAALRAITPYSLERVPGFGGKYCLHFHALNFNQLSVCLCLLLDRINFILQTGDINSSKSPYLSLSIVFPKQIECQLS